MAEYLIQDVTLVGIADAIRGKTGSSEVIAISNMAEIISEIETSSGGFDTLIEKGMVLSKYANNDIVCLRNYVFQNNSNLTSVSFPACITIGTQAFQSCTSLISVDFQACTTIGNYAFGDCSSLMIADFPACTTIGSGAFNQCYSLPAADFPVCTSMGNYAFSDCSSLTSVNFPVCTSIGSSAFANCSNLTSVSFPACTSINANTFYFCSRLTSVDFPACTSIGAQAFQACYSLISVDFPACTTIGILAFNTCSNLTTANFPVCTRIYDYAFYNCPSLTSVYFPVCTSIGSIAFANCSNLTSVSFPACITIGTQAFQSCTSLISVDFQACTTISASAFNGCVNLRDITLRASSVISLGASNVFTGIPSSASIYVPASLVNTYKTATNWSYYSNYIYPIIGSDGEIDSGSSSTSDYIIDISMLDGTNLTGLSDYNASVISNGSFSNGKFVTNGSGALVIPTDFMEGTGTWTIAFAIDSYVLNINNAYCRLARGSKDVPSIFYRPAAEGFMIKMTTATVFASYLEWYDTTFLAPWGDVETNALVFNIPTNEKAIFVFMNDGEHISMWVNGEMKAKALATNYTSTYYASTFAIGDDQSKGYDMSSITCSMFKAWNRALSASEIAEIL